MRMKRRGTKRSQTEFVITILIIILLMAAIFCLCACGGQDVKTYKGLNSEEVIDIAQYGVQRIMLGKFVGYVIK